MNKKDVTIIIVTYKSVHIILESLKNIVGKGYHIMIVDNGSNDSIKNLLKQNYPNSDIELILLTNNCGFGRANNIALEKITTKYAFIQNPDAIITEISIDNLVKEAEKDKNIALANPFPTTKAEPSKSEQQDAINNYKKKIKILNEDKNIIETTSICGGYMLMNMNIFRKIGFFDRNLFLYGEDVELSQRSIAKGYKNILVKNAHVFHYGQKSTEIHGTLAKYKMLYFRSWHQGWGKTYLKRKNKNVVKIWLKIFHRLFLAIFYLLKFDLNKAINRFAIFSGSISNLIGINCFKKNNKIPKIKKESKL